MSLNPVLLREEKLLADFRIADLSSYPRIHQYKKKSESAMWVLWVLNEKFPRNEWVPPDIISNILVKVLGISSTPKSVKIALEPIHGTLVHKDTTGGEVLYKIMEMGKDHLKNIAGEGKTTVYNIGGTTPRSDKQFLKDVLKSASGEIKIVDPYFGSQTLANLEQFDLRKTIKLLTVDISLRRHQSRTAFDSELTDFKTEHSNFQVRQHITVPKELHDRYILTNDSIIFIGQGIKDLGGKESFILSFDGQSIGKSIRDDLNAKFDQRWNAATPL